MNTLHVLLDEFLLFVVSSSGTSSSTGPSKDPSANRSVSSVVSQYRLFQTTFIAPSTDPSRTKERMWKNDAHQHTVSVGRVLPHSGTSRRGTHDVRRPKRHPLVQPLTQVLIEEQAHLLRLGVQFSCPPILCIHLVLSRCTFLSPYCCIISACQLASPWWEYLFIPNPRSIRTRAPGRDLFPHPPLHTHLLHMVQKLWFKQSQLRSLHHHLQADRLLSPHSPTLLQPDVLQFHHRPVLAKYPSPPPTMLRNTMYL
jgi:hypothetical protein